jgi:hypothetical protein
MGGNVTSQVDRKKEGKNISCNISPSFFSCIPFAQNTRRSLERY